MLVPAANQYSADRNAFAAHFHIHFTSRGLEYQNRTRESQTYGKR